MRIRFTLAACSILWAALAAPSWSMDLKLGTEVYGAFNTYSMSAFNDNVVDVFNSTGAFDFQPIDKGVTGGVGLRARLGPRLAFSAIWEPLYADTRSVFFAADSTGTEVDGSARYNFDVNTYQLGATWFLGKPGFDWLGFGGALAVYQLSGETSATLYAPGIGVDVAGGNHVVGNTVGVHVAASTEWQVAHRIAVTGGLGYRYAKITNAKQQTPDGDEPLGGDLDYSGLFARLGVAFYFTGVGGGGAAVAPPSH